MSAKTIHLHEKARAGIVKGASLVAEAARVTLGPKGRHVMIQKSFGAPTVTKDGVTVVKEIDLEDKFENMGAKLIREVAQKTSDVAGDGTTTATVLARAVLREGLLLLAAGMAPMDLKRGMEAAVAKASEAIKAMARPVKDHERMVKVATVAANGDKGIGKIIADAMGKVGMEGVITVEEASGLETMLDLVEGMRFDRGYLSPYFVTNPERMTIELDEPLILFHEKKISNMRELLPLLEHVVQSGRPQLLIIRRGRPDCTTRSSNGSSSRMLEIFFSWILARANSNRHALGVTFEESRKKQNIKRMPSTGSSLVHRPLASSTVITPFPHSNLAHRVDDESCQNALVAIRPPRWRPGGPSARDPSPAGPSPLSPRTPWRPRPPCRTLEWPSAPFRRRAAADPRAARRGQVGRLWWCHRRRRRRFSGRPRASAWRPCSRTCLRDGNSLTTVTPSSVTVGAPKLFWIITWRPLGPSVTRAASATSEAP